MLQRPALFAELDASLAALIPGEDVEFTGKWLPSERRTYQAAGQVGTGAGPFEDVVDLRWRGTLVSSVPIAGVAFLVGAREIFWVRSAPAAPVQPVDISLHAYADSSAERATFVAGMGGSLLPGVPVSCGVELASCCALTSRQLMTTRVEQLAQVDTTAFFVLLLPSKALKVGRHRLWRVRDKLASDLPPPVRKILTHRRSGTITIT